MTRFVWITQLLFAEERGQQCQFIVCAAGNSFLVKETPIEGTEAAHKTLCLRHKFFQMYIIRPEIYITT
jgi:hypothetical protein